MDAPDDPNRSPTTSIYRVLITLTTALLISMVFDARGIVHSGNGMPDGPQRSAALVVGRTVVRLAEAVHLTWPWDRLQSALGRSSQPALPPLLASGSADPPAVPRGAPAARALASSVSVLDFVRLLLLPRRTVPRRAPHRASTPDAALRPTRLPTPANPLRLLVTGDSLSGYLGPELVDEASHVGPVRGFVDTHNGTGLTRPDFVDWSLVARQQVAADNPDAVVVLMGGNDFQNMTLPGGKFFLAGTPAWTREYQRRAAICMSIWAERGARRVYWLSIPPARDPSWAQIDGQINLALRRAAAQVPGAEYVDILGPVTNHGRYVDFVYVHGQPILVREPDGVHLNVAGSTIVAHEVLPLIVRDWRLGYRPPPHQLHGHHRRRHRRRFR